MRRAGGPGRRIIRLALLLAAGAALLLLLAQLFLPGIAASRISSRLGRYGSVKNVTVSAWPAVKLLWGGGGSATVTAGSLSLSPSQAAKLLWEARGLGRIDLAASGVSLGSLRLTDARLSKRGGSLAAEATIGQADVEAALPRGLSLQLLRSEAGQVLVRASGGLFGARSPVDAVAAASEGRLVVHPLGPPFESARLTLFADPHVYVEGVGASFRPGSPSSYRLTISARLR
jgi:hypothetical protein